MNTPAPLPPRVSFPVVRVLAGAVVVLLERRRALLHALTMPAAMAVFLTLLIGSQAEPAPGLVLGGMLLELAVYVVLAVNVHRLVLVGAGEVPPLGLSGWGLREWRYLGWLWFQMLCAIMVAFTLGPLVALGPLGIAVLSVVSAWAFARASLLLPGAAVERQIGLREAWLIGRGNGWRLMLIVFGIPAAELLLLWPAYSVGPLPVKLFATLAGLLVTSWVIASLSLAWQTLLQRSGLQDFTRPGAASTVAPPAGDEATAAPVAPRVRLMPDAARGILELVTSGRFGARDLGRAASGDTLHAYHGRLRGLVVSLAGDDWEDAEGQADWDALDTLLSHLGFVRIHHEHIVRVALVGAPGWAGVCGQLGKHFGRAEVRYFTPAGIEAARAWAAGEGAAAE